VEVVGFGKGEEKGKREELIAIIKSYIRLKGEWYFALQSDIETKGFSVILFGLKTRVSE
jgi:hypothetical protein